MNESLLQTHGRQSINLNQKCTCVKLQSLYFGFGFTVRPYPVVTGSAGLGTSVGVSGFCGEGGISMSLAEVILFWVVCGVGAFVYSFAVLILCR